MNMTVFLIFIKSIMLLVNSIMFMIAEMISTLSLILLLLTDEIALSEDNRLQLHYIKS